MLNRISEQLTLAVADAVGLPVSPIPRGLSYWEIIDTRSGGVWSFRFSETVFNLAWRPIIHVYPDVFTLNVHYNDGKIEATFDEPVEAQAAIDTKQMRRIGIFLLSGIQKFEVPSCVHRELNDYFIRFSSYDQRKGAMASVGEIGLSHPDPFVRKCFEEAERQAQNRGTMDERHGRLYQGSALDDQKDPSKVN